MPKVRAVSLLAAFSPASILILTVLLGTCWSCKGAAQAGDAPKQVASVHAPEQAQAGESAAQAPVSNLTERLAREKFTGDLDGLMKRRFIRVLVVADRTSIMFDGAQMRGLMYDSLREFETWLNRKYQTGKSPVALVFQPVDRDHVVEALGEGRGDIVGKPVAIEETWKEYGDFTAPVREHISYVVVTGPNSPALPNIEDLSGKEVYLHKASTFYLAVERLNERFKREGRAPVLVNEADPNLGEDDILEMLNAGLIGLTVARDLNAAFWSKIYTNIHPHPELVVASGESNAIGVRKNCPQLVATLNEFLKDHREGTAYGNTMLNRYLRDTKWVRDSLEAGELQKFGRMVSLFRQYGDKYGFPYLLVAAQAYQESRLEQTLHSPAGAVGVMQIKPTTAAGNPINIRDVTQLDGNIEAGVKYLRFMVDTYYKDEPMDQIHKGLFAVASYNAGPNRIASLRKKAKDEGLDPNRWFNNVELIAAREIGRETVQYVSNVYKYYLAYAMVTEQQAKAREAREGSLKK